MREYSGVSDCCIRPRRTWRDDQRDHAGAVPPRRLQRLDQLLHLPDLDILVGVLGCLAHLCGLLNFGSLKLILENTTVSCIMNVLQLVCGGSPYAYFIIVLLHNLGKEEGIRNHQIVQ